MMIDGAAGRTRLEELPQHWFTSDSGSLGPQRW